MEMANQQTEGVISNYFVPRSASPSKLLQDSSRVSQLIDTAALSVVPLEDEGQQLRELQEYQQRRFHQWVRSQAHPTNGEGDAEAEDSAEHLPVSLVSGASPHARLAISSPYSSPLRGQAGASTSAPKSMDHHEQPRLSSPSLTQKGTAAVNSKTQNGANKRLKSAKPNRRRASLNDQESSRDSEIRAQLSPQEARPSRASTSRLIMRTFRSSTTGKPVQQSEGFQQRSQNPKMSCTSSSIASEDQTPRTRFTFRISGQQELSSLETPYAPDNSASDDDEEIFVRASRVGSLLGVMAMGGPLEPLDLQVDKSMGSQCDKASVFSETSTRHSSGGNFAGVDVMEEPIPQLAFRDFHFQSVRPSAAAALGLTLVLIILPVAILKIATLWDIRFLLNLFGSVAESANNWSDARCEASVRMLYTQTAYFSFLGLIITFAVWMLLRMRIRKPDQLFYFFSFIVAMASVLGLVSSLHVTKMSVVNLQLMLMSLPGAFHLRTNHSVLGVAPPVITTVIMTVAGRTSPDLCQFSTTTIVVMVVLAVLAVLQTASTEAQLRRLYNSSKVHKEQLEEQKHFLKHMLPPQALKIALAGTSTAQGSEFKRGTIMMVDVNMEQAANLLPPSALVESLDRIFICFDELIESAPEAVYKVETVGSVYMVAAGVPFKHPDHAHMMLDTALQFLDTTASLQWSETLRMKIRCGVHSGKLFAGVPGMVCPRYRYFGDTVNTAARLESKAPWGKVWVSEATKDLLRRPTQDFSSQLPQMWRLVPLGRFWFKGKGNLLVFEVESGLVLNRTQMVVNVVEDEAIRGMEQVALRARKRMSTLLESPSLKLKVSEHTLFARSSPSRLNRLFDLLAATVSKMRAWQAFRQTVPSSWATWYLTEAQTFSDVVLEEDLRHPELTILLTFTSPRLEDHHRHAEAYKRRRVVATSTFLGTGMVLWSLVAYNVAECDPREQTALLLYTSFAVVLTTALSALLVKQSQWTMYWWPYISLLLSIVFMTWMIMLPCGGILMSALPVQMGIAYIWIMLAHSAFALPFRLCFLSSLLVIVYFMGYSFPESCDVDPRSVWPECESMYDESPSDHRQPIILISPVLVALHTFWHNEVRSRRQFVTVLQAHRRRRQAVRVVKSLLPEHVFQMQGQLRNSSMQVNHYIPMVNQLFSDIVGFTSQVAQMKPIAVFEMIATLFGAFDELTSDLGVLKIETIGDAYWACTGSVSGGDCLPAHATALALFGFKMQEEASKIYPLGPDKPSLKIRVGLHSGPVVGGITGTTMPRYHLFGPHVALTNQMESLGSAYYLLATNSFAVLLRDDPLCPPDLDVITKDTSFEVHHQMLQCENIRWGQVNKSMKESGMKLQLKPNELDLLTPVVTITRQRCTRIHVNLVVQGDRVASFMELREMPGDRFHIEPSASDLGEPHLSITFAHTEEPAM